MPTVVGAQVGVALATSATIPASYPGRRRPRAGVQYVQRVSRIANVARRYGFDVLIVLAGARRHARGRGQARLAGRAAHDAVVRRAGDRGHRAPAARAPALPLRRARRRSGCSRRRSRSSTGGWSRSSTQRLRRSGWRPRSCSATCATPCRRGSGWPSCSAARRSSSTTSPAHVGRRARLHPARCSRSAGSAGFALRERAEQAEAAEERATQRRAGARGGGPRSRSPRSARGSRASSTTSSPTRSA